MKLYVIGNGFDVHHGLDTRYTSFGLYLKNNYWETYDLLLEHYGFGDLNPDYPTSMSDPLWSEFETSMSLLDTGSVLEANMDAMPNYASDDFRDRDRYTLEIEMDRILGLLTTELYKAFKEFILSVELPDYDVDELVLGHGVDPENFKEKPVEPPTGLSEEDLERWIEYQSDQYDYSFERGKDAINDYFSTTFKGTEQIIKNNEGFFSKLANIDEVYVLGHSLADVDLPYFHKLAQSVKPDAKWVATFYDPDDEEGHCDTLTGLGIANVSVVRMEQL